MGFSGKKTGYGDKPVWKNEDLFLICPNNSDSEKSTVFFKV
jgi:hypothetical protein